MPYREKTAWLALFAIAVAFIPYFAYVGLTRDAGAAMPDLRQLIAYGIAACVRMAVLGSGHLVLAAREGPAARLPADERDKAIRQRASSSAYYVLMAGMILVGVVMPFSQTGWAIVNAALFMIVVSEVVQGGMMVFSYRRQS